MEFPAVTICNQNSFRRTLSLKNGHYEILKALYEKEDSSRGRDVLLERSINVTMETLYTNNSHRAEDLIVTCKWKGEACNWSDFKPVLTQHGQCFTFLGNTTTEDGRIVDSPGVDNGLELVLNVEDYDSMVGPHSSSGVKVVLHHDTEVPMPEFGNELPTGRHGFMDVQVSKAQNVPPPHGNCVDRTLMYMGTYSYTVGACQMECEMQFSPVLQRCAIQQMFGGIESEIPPTP
ncbi:acid-sensing ion channel 1-like [Pecten maximus]|uniref:acid-sensing ion channel 1-like n=1 Tax=Pecten maximus TaxID=6579 RepID=UPI001458FCAD|nr:acid-sensing ion channel 1-like [Pecten maximus]